MKSGPCCNRVSVPCVRGLCVRCFNASRQPRKRATPHAAFDYALEYAFANLPGAQRLTAWALQRAATI
jgi:hypothetical protein